MGRVVTVMLSSAAGILWGCTSNPTNPDECNIRLAIVSPDPAVLAVGDAVTLQAELTEVTGCLPADARAGQLRWTTDDTMIATVDSLTGRLTAVQVGTATVSLLGAVTRTSLAHVAVQVLSP
jgi:hypothetical protein